MKPDLSSASVAPGQGLLTTADYTRVLRPLLPKEAFAAWPSQMIYAGCHLAIIALGVFWLSQTTLNWAAPLVALVNGHSLACLAFIAHDTSHHSVVKNRVLRKITEMLLWSLNCVPTTLWQRVHNQSHHAETNTLKDPDRSFRKCESTVFTWAYMRTFYPNKKTPFRHPLALVHFVTYVLRQLITALLPGKHKLSVVPFKPRYSAFQRLLIVVELLLIAGVQYLLWRAVGGEAWKYVWVGPGAVLVTSAIAMTYIWTNHFLNPLCEHTDPLIGTTSVVVPRWMNWLHDNFSYHTEHHLFPSMNPRYYPLVSDLIVKHFPERYHRVPLAEAWRRLYASDEFIVERQSVRREDSVGQSN